MIIPAMKLTIKEVEPRIYHIGFSNQRDLWQSMMRLQEYYEGKSELLRGNYFTFEELMHVFTNENGEFLNADICYGFNIPGAVVIKWFDLFSTQSGGLTIKETQTFVALFQKLTNSSEPWYLIATAKSNSKLIIKHEIAHGRFSINESYKDACLNLISEIEHSDMLRISLAMTAMYNVDVVNDEIQAYLSTETNVALRLWFGVLHKNTQNVVKKLKRLYKEYKG